MLYEKEAVTCPKVILKCSRGGGKGSLINEINPYFLMNIFYIYILYYIYNLFFS